MYFYGDLICCTHNGTGGNGTITLASAVSTLGTPQPTDALGTSGTRLVGYRINEYTDSTKTKLQQSERGRGSLALSTNVLTRSEIHLTWNGTTWTRGGASALTFGNTAANIEILLGASDATQRPALPGINASNDGYTAFNTRQAIDSTSAGVALVNGTKYYMPMEFAYGKAITAIGINATSIATTGNVRISLYEWGTDGLPGNLITEFTSSSQISVSTATGIKFITLSTPFWIPPGWYYVMIQADAAVTLLQARVYASTGAGSSGSRDVMNFNKTGTYGAAPATGDTGLSTTTRSAGDQWVVYIK